MQRYIKRARPVLFSVVTIFLFHPTGKSRLRLQLTFQSDLHWGYAHAYLAVYTHRRGSKSGEADGLYAVLCCAVLYCFGPGWVYAPYLVVFGAVHPRTGVVHLRGRTPRTSRLDLAVRCPGAAQA
jgi:hypothetical protein